MNEDSTPLKVSDEVDGVACVTRWARFCLWSGALALLAGVISFIPDPEGVDMGPLGSVSSYLILALLGLALFLPLTAITAITAALRIRFSKQSFRGGNLIWIGIALALLGWVLPAVWEQLYPY